MQQTTLTLTLMIGLFSLLFRGAQAQPNSFREADYSSEKTRFTLFAPDTAKNVRLFIYEDAVVASPTKTVRMHRTQKDTFTAELKGDLRGKFYTFDIGMGQTPGVFATAVGVNGHRAAIIDMAETNPEGWDTEWESVSVKSPCERVVYELHHRDFSIDPSSGIVHKGKFLALTEEKAIDHLKRLGVNTVHILPSFDFASIDEAHLDTPQYNWGYDPLNYNVPEGSYSTDPFTPETRIREFKEMVRSLHAADIDVVLDVVYNHTFNIEESNFQRTYPDYFYRFREDGTFSDGSGCGNEPASEREEMRRFMLLSMTYWMEEYHIDGFRVDLMGVHDIETMNTIREALEERFGRAFIYGEGWSAGECAYPLDLLATKAHILRMPGIAAFSDELRDALRGPFSDDSEGAFLAAIPGEEESVKFGIVGAIAHPQVDLSRVNYSQEAWANEPTQMVAYVSCHDDMCLVDRLRASIPNITQNELIRLDLLAQTAVFTSQGIPFLLCGEEMLRTKQGVHNSYCSPDSINHLDWTNLKKYPQVFDYYSRLISMRRNHPAFRLGSADVVRESLEFLPTEDCLVAFRLKDHAGGDLWENIIVVLNSNREPRSLSVPSGRYTVVCRDGRINEDGLDVVDIEDGYSLSVPPQSAMIIHE